MCEQNMLELTESLFKNTLLRKQFLFFFKSVRSVKYDTKPTANLCSSIGTVCVHRRYTEASQLNLDIYH